MTKEPLNMTNEEFNQIKEAMKKEEFRKLLCEYADELADPVKRQQYEDELVELESQRGVQMKFIKPDPGFVIKVMDSEAKKVFVNVCMSELVSKPEFEYKEKQGDNGKVEQGQQCQLPYSVSPPHEERDNKEVVCQVYDVVFHPEVIFRCSNPAFKNMVVDTALNSLTSQFHLILNTDSIKFPKILFKGTPSQSVIRQRIDEEKPDAFKHLPKRPDFPDLPGEKKKKKEKSKGAGKAEKPADEPEYKIVYRDDVDMGNFTNDRIGSSAPSHIIVTISLPLHNTTREVDLDVYSDQLELHSQHYNLTLNLPHTVDSERGAAKFDKERHELKVTLEVIAKEVPPEFLLPEQSALVNEVPGTASADTSPPVPGTASTDTSPTPLHHHPPSDISIQQPKQGKIQTTNVPETALSETVPSEPLSETETKYISETETKPEFETETKPVSDVETKSVSETETKSVSETETKPVSETETNSVSETETNSVSETETNSVSETETKTRTESEGSAELADIHITVSEAERIPEVESPCPSESPTPKCCSTRFSVSPVPCDESEAQCYDTYQQLDPDMQHSTLTHTLPSSNKEEEDPLANTDIYDDCSLYSGLSSYTDISAENDISVNIRVYQDITTATLILDTVYNSVPDVQMSGKTIWLRNADVVLYLLLPHSITTYTIDMSSENVCLVLYKQHSALWSSLYIGHSEDEVFSYKFITEDNVERLVESLREPWGGTSTQQHGTGTPHLQHTDTHTLISCTGTNRPHNILINSPPDSEDDAIKGILKSPHSPSPLSPARSRKVSFNEEVETFVLPSKRSLKGKRRRKKKNGSNSASESSDDASSPSPNSVVPDPRTMSDMQEGEMQLASAQNTPSSNHGNHGNNKRGKNTSKSKNTESRDASERVESENKENLLNSEREAVQKVLDPTGSAAHRMKLTNPLIYELDD